jgi:hypothetical protein
MMLHCIYREWVEEHADGWAVFLDQTTSVLTVSTAADSTTGSKADRSLHC